MKSTYRTWTGIIREYDAIYRPPLAKRGTFHWHKKTIDRLARSIAKPSELSAGGIASVVRHMLTEERLSPHYAASMLRSVRKICNDLVAHQVLQTTPFTKGHKLVIPARELRRRHPIEVPTADQVAAILAAVTVDHSQASGMRDRYRTGRMRAIVHVLAYTGIRAGEAGRLDWRDVDLARRTIEITDRHEAAKTERSHAILPLAEPAAVVLEEWRVEQAQILGGVSQFVFRGPTKDSAWTGGSKLNNPRLAMRALGDRVGIPGLHLKKWRHIFATLARTRWGLSREQVREILRHTTDDTQEHYCHGQLEELRAVVKLVNYTA